MKLAQRVKHEQKKLPDAGFNAGNLFFVSCLAAPLFSLAFAAEVKPEVVITTENYKDYPEIKKLMPLSLHKQVFENPLDRIFETRIVPYVKIEQTPGMKKKIFL